MSSIQEVTDAFKTNLILAVPTIVAIVISFVIGTIIVLATTAALIPFGYISPTMFYTLAVGLPAITMGTSLITVLFTGIAIAVTCSMAQDVLVKARPDIMKSWREVREKLTPIIILALIQAIVSATLQLIPILGWIIALLLNLLFIPAYILVITKDQASLEALNRALQILQDFYRRDQNLFILLILVILAMALPVIGPIVAVFSIPYSILAFSYHMETITIQESRVQYCTHCGAEVGPDERFCGSCGRPVG